VRGPQGGPGRAAVHWRAAALDRGVHQARRRPPGRDRPGPERPCVRQRPGAGRALPAGGRRDQRLSPRDRPQGGPVGDGGQPHELLRQPGLRRHQGVFGGGPGHPAGLARIPYRFSLTAPRVAAMSAEDLERYETEIELQLYKEYNDVIKMFSFVVETERRFYLANSVDMNVKEQDGRS